MLKKFHSFTFISISFSFTFESTFSGSPRNQVAGEENRYKQLLKELFAVITIMAVGQYHNCHRQYSTECPSTVAGTGVRSGYCHIS